MLLIERPSLKGQARRFLEKFARHSSCERPLKFSSASQGEISKNLRDTPFNKDLSNDTTSLSATLQRQNTEILKQIFPEK